MKILLAPMEWGMTKVELEHAGTRCGKKKPHIIGLTEMRKAWMKTSFMKGMPTRYRMTAGGECPIVYDSNFLELVSLDWEIVTKGYEGVTPNLPVVVAIFRNRRTKKKIRIVHDHMVPLSLDGRRREDHRELRSQMWDDHWAVKAHKVHTSGTIPTIVMGDWNNIWLSRESIKKTFPRAKIIVNDRLDKMLAIGARQFRYGLSWTVNTGSDHKGRGKTLFLR